jgi:universal stress protein A
MTKSSTSYKNILLATDLSENCDFVAKRAADIAHVMHAKLNMIHVLAYTPIAYAGEFSIPVDAELDLTMEKEAKAHLARLGKKYNVAKEDQHIEQGSVKLAVTELSKKIKADLIIVGTHGHEGLDVLLGSQANAILHAAKCDVWVVRIK